MVQGSLAFGLYNLVGVSLMGEELCLWKITIGEAQHTLLCSAEQACASYLSKTSSGVLQELVEMAPLTKGHIVAIQMTVTGWVLTPAPGQGWVGPQRFILR